MVHSFHIGLEVHVPFQNPSLVLEVHFPFQIFSLVLEVHFPFQIFFLSFLNSFARHTTEAVMPRHLASAAKGSTGVQTAKPTSHPKAAIILGICGVVEAESSSELSALRPGWMPRNEKNASHAFKFTMDFVKRSATRPAPRVCLAFQHFNWMRSLITNDRSLKCLVLHGPSGAWRILRPVRESPMSTCSP